MMARAVAANTPANLKDNSGSHGQSRIIKDDGNILQEASFFGDEILIEKLSIGEGKLEEPLKGIMGDWWRQGIDAVSKNRGRKLE
jgi:hypothetical protein